MTTTRVLFLCLAAALFVPASAQGLGPDLPKLSNLAFGWVSMSGLDPTLDMLTSFAPASLALRDNGYRTGGEAVAGHFDYSGFDVDSEFQSAMTAMGPGLFRICHYAYDSNVAPVIGIQIPSLSTNTQTDGEAVELSYAQHVGKATVGVSVIPEDSSTVNLSMHGQNLVNGESTTDYGARAGVILPVAENIRLGGEYSYQKDTGVTRVSPMLTGAPGWVESSGSFLTRAATIGASAKLRPTTQVYSAYQDIVATGSTLGHRVGDQWWLGVQQDLSKTLAVRANYLERGENFSVQWRSPFGLMNIAYTHNALMNAESILGQGDAEFISLALAF